MIQGRDQAIEVIAVTILAAVLTRRLRTSSLKKPPRRWIPIAALISGPVVAFAWCVIDYYVSPGSYVRPEDFAAQTIPAVSVGLVAGMVGALAFWIAEH